MPVTDALQKCDEIQKRKENDHDSTVLAWVMMMHNSRFTFSYGTPNEKINAKQTMSAVQNFTEY